MSSITSVGEQAERRSDANDSWANWLLTDMYA